MKQLRGTQYSHLTNDELIRTIDTFDNLNNLEYELACRLFRMMERMDEIEDVVNELSEAVGYWAPHQMNLPLIPNVERVTQ